MAIEIAVTWTCEECGNTETETVEQDMLDTNLNETEVRPMGWEEIDKDGKLKWTIMCPDCAEKWEEEHPDDA